jgi:hypothetical protein
MANGSPGPRNRSGGLSLLLPWSLKLAGIAALAFFGYRDPAHILTYAAAIAALAASHKLLK